METAPAVSLAVDAALVEQECMHLLNFYSLERACKQVACPHTSLIVFN
jgi:hypothetical protein